MAWTATDDFESYSNGNINTLNGGSNWAEAWSSPNGLCEILTFATHKCVGLTGGGCNLNRTPSVNTGELNFQFDIATHNSSGGGGYYMGMAHAGVASKFLLYIENGKYQVYDWGTNQKKDFPSTSGNWVADTWQTVYVRINTSTNKFTAKIDSGDWTSEYDTNSNGLWSSSMFFAHTDDSNAVYYLDNIGAYSPNRTFFPYPPSKPY